MTAKRERIAALIRALRAKTVENGCTEGEAVAAAEKLAELLRQHDMTLDEAELRESPFSRHHEEHDDWVGERLWKIADGISHMTGVRYWTERSGMTPSIDFFGFAHEVDVARYLLDICRHAMRTEEARILRNPRLVTRSRQRRAVTPFLDGMADRLRQRLRELKPPTPTGTGLVVLHGALIDQAMKDNGLGVEQGRGRRSRDLEPGYVEGLSAADRVALNRGVAGGRAMGMLR